MIMVSFSQTKQVVSSSCKNIQSWIKNYYLERHIFQTRMRMRNTGSRYTSSMENKKCRLLFNLETGRLLAQRRTHSSSARYGVSSSLKRCGSIDSLNSGTRLFSIRLKASMWKVSPCSRVRLMFSSTKRHLCKRMLNYWKTNYNLFCQFLLNQFSGQQNLETNKYTFPFFTILVDAIGKSTIEGVVKMYKNNFQL